MCNIRILNLENRTLCALAPPISPVPFSLYISYFPHCCQPTQLQFLFCRPFPSATRHLHILFPLFGTVSPPCSCRTSCASLRPHFKTLIVRKLSPIPSGGEAPLGCLLIALPPFCVAFHVVAVFKCLFIHIKITPEYTLGKPNRTRKPYLKIQLHAFSLPYAFKVKKQIIPSIPKVSPSSDCTCPEGK